MEKRLDNKKRLLHTGESQRKNGLYVYKYVEYGVPKFVYSWKLVATDPLPKGKRNCVPLREQEKLIKRDIEDGIDTIGKKMTLCDLYAKQNNTHANVKRRTVKNRKNLMKLLEGDVLGHRSICDIKPSDAKEWAVRMKEKGNAYGSINNLKRALTASFYTAIEDDYVRKNPFLFNLNDVIKDDTIHKEALSVEQQNALLWFIRADRVYKRLYDAILILLNTGLRSSELCGLTLSDIDFDNMFINIDHQLLKDKDGYYIDTPKTESSFRKIPITPPVYKALKRAIKNRDRSKPITVDGYKDFIFLSKKGCPLYNSYYTRNLKYIVAKYNKYHPNNELPHITSHILRHSFCTNMAIKGMSPTNLQYIMGHKSIEMTLGYYAHGNGISAQKEMARLVS